MKNVLLIDDGTYSRRNVREALKDYDIKLTEKTSPLDGFKELLTRKYDVAFIDYLMPTMNGIDLIKSLDNINLTTRIYLLTGWEMDDIKEKTSSIQDKIIGVIDKVGMEYDFEKIFNKKGE